MKVTDFPQHECKENDYGGIAIILSPMGAFLRHYGIKPILHVMTNLFRRFFVLRLTNYSQREKEVDLGFQVNYCPFCGLDFTDLLEQCGKSE